MKHIRCQGLLFIGVILSFALYSTVKLRLSPTRSLYGHPNLKWVVKYLKSFFNRVTIRENYFGLPERHNLNMGIISPRNIFAKKDSLLDLVVGEDAE